VAFPERVAVFYAVLLLIQAAIEFGKEEKGYVVSLEKREGSAASLSQTWSTLSKYLANDEKERVQWAAASYLSLTPATQMILLNRNDGIVYRLGSTAPPADSISTELEGTQAAFASLDKSSSGRISLPLTHPTVVALNISEVESRCVVLQKIDKESCWIMTSNQLLTAFTNDDLKWLGQLAKHVTHSSK
jgi:hypothetical protein